MATAGTFNYVTTAHKASGVISAVVGHFTASDELNLIIRCAQGYGTPRRFNFFNIMNSLQQVHARGDTSRYAGWPSAAT